MRKVLYPLDEQNISHKNITYFCLRLRDTLKKEKQAFFKF